MNKYNATYIICWIGSGVAFLIMLLSWNVEPLTAAFMFIASAILLFAGIGAYKGVKGKSKDDHVYNETRTNTTQNTSNLFNTVTLNDKEYELKYKYHEVKFTCVAMNEYAAAAHNVNIGDLLKLKADPNAVAILSSDDKIIGYLYKGTLQDMVNDYLRMKKPIVAFAENKPVSTITLGFYGKPSIPEKDKYQNWLERANGYTVFKLTSNLTNDMQENIALMESGNPIKTEYDEEKQRFLITDENGLELGYLKNKNLSENDIDSACVESVELMMMIST